MVAWWVWAALGYVIGAVLTFHVNLYDMVFVTRPLVIIRNVVFWPFFIWPLAEIAFHSWSQSRERKRKANETLKWLDDKYGKAEDAD